MNCITKRLQTGDVEDLKELLLVFSRTFEEKLTRPTDAYLLSLLAKPDFYAVAAYREGVVIGGITGYELMLPTGEKEMYMYDLAVDEKYRGQGVATALIEKMKACAKESGVSLLFVEAETKDLGAVAFYRSLQGEELETVHFNISVD